MSMSREALHAFMDANCAVLRSRTTESAAQSEAKFLKEENESLQREIDSQREQIEHDQEELCAARREVQKLRQSSRLQSKDVHESRSTLAPTRGSSLNSRYEEREQDVKDDVMGKGKGKGRADDINYALQLHHSYQDEDARQREYLHFLQLSEHQEIFECIICMEKMPLDDVANVDLCGHKLCRDCMKSYVSSKIEERKYPIMCPVCSAQNTADMVGSK